MTRAARPTPSLVLDRVTIGAWRRGDVAFCVFSTSTPAAHDRYRRTESESDVIHLRECADGR